MSEASPEVVAAMARMVKAIHALPHKHPLWRMTMPDLRMLAEAALSSPDSKGMTK